jgi:hypothetical protein
MATDISTDSEQSGTSGESEPRLTSEASAPTDNEMREIECSIIQRCLDIMGESPLKRPSKVTPKYAREKKS